MNKEMSQEKAKAWLPLIQAVAEGKTIQSGCFDYFAGGIVKQTWTDSHLPLQLEGIDPKYFRIKPEPKKQSYRVALLKDGDGYWAKTINHESYYFSDDKDVTFVRWLTDFIEYELPEGEV